ncbi:MAG: SDR family NAD(P)-dependent oxidoreductase [Candidatus Omnitrophota bacterium]
MFKGICVIIGCSRGLGAALVDELINDGCPMVIGVARTKLEDIEQGKEWLASNRYKHVIADIGAESSVNILTKISLELPMEPLLIIFNAACLTSDVTADKRINYDVFKKVNRVGVDGLGYVLQSFEEHLCFYGGIFVGISSTNAIKPPVFEYRLAYGASKAYLDMALRNLSFLWPPKIKVINFHLGHIGGGHDLGYLPVFLKATYNSAAKKIIREVSRQRVPSEVTYPVIYRIAYQYILKIIPDSVYINCSKFFCFLLKRGANNKNR